ncbi:transmembrane protein 17B isoform X2 [Phycodurus eques]|uniref:transmembrane protein 17B isoform X2 n=1 Tax=Phycodurus eques TaxID=693459 RepID=UPI002ACE0981|nr:transmembrane protein 17B isoform X2 [Phycodurus eques]
MQRENVSPKQQNSTFEQKAGVARYPWRREQPLLCANRKRRVAFLPCFLFCVRFVSFALALALASGATSHGHPGHYPKTFGGLFPECLRGAEPGSLSGAPRVVGTRRVLSSLPLQMSLFFNMCFFPLWWISEMVMLRLKYSALPDYYKFILVTVLIVMTVIEAIRLYLGYVGNLREKIAELAGFWLLSILLQLPQILFQLFNEAILVQPLERGIHIVLALFILTQVCRFL